MYSYSRWEKNKLQHWRVVCSIWKPKCCRKTGSPFLLKRKKKKSNGLGSCQWNEVLFSISLGKPTQCLISMCGRYLAPHLIDPHANGLSRAFQSPKKERDCCHLVMKVILCAGGNYFQSLRSAYALHLITHMKNEDRVCNCRACASCLKNPENTAEQESKAPKHVQHLYF